MMKKVLKDQEGAVLVLVLIVLVASIIMGVMIIRTSVQESRMAGNERRYLQTFADLENTVTLALVTNTEAISSVGTTAGRTYTYTDASVHDYLPDNNDNINLSVTLSETGKPPKGSGNDPASMQARYYTIRASEKTGGSMAVTVGAFKVFKK
jgi:Tfp pilus assembly protein PilX